jgi:hypothetical protein
MTTILSSLWRGHYSLPMAFLGFYIFGSCVVFFIAFLAMVLAFHLRLPVAQAWTLCLVVLGGYWAIASVGVWRSAAVSLRSGNWASRLEGWLARGTVALLGSYAVWVFYSNLPA